MDNIRFGITATKIEDWEKTIRLSKNLGFDHVEAKIRSSNDFMLYNNYDFLDRIKDLCQQENITLSIHGSDDLCFAYFSNRLQKYAAKLIIEQIVAADRMGSKWITFHLGKNPFSDQSKKKDEMKQRIYKTLDQIDETCGHMPIQIALENMPKKPESEKCCHIGNSVKELYEIVSHSNSKKIIPVLDIGHLILNRSLSEIKAELNQAKHSNQIMHFHCNNQKEDLHIGLSSEFIQMHQLWIKKLICSMPGYITVVLEMDVQSAVQTREMIHLIYKDK